MEGYTNVIGGPYDFDDLDIEGRVVDEWNAGDEEKHSSGTSFKHSSGEQEFDGKTLLGQRVKLDNGKYADAFSVVKKNDCTWYTCNVCNVTVEGLAAFRQHVQSRAHRSNMNTPVHPCTKFLKLDPKENMALEPGEPIPPGLEEDLIKTCIIQPKLDAYKSPLIGLEYLVELTETSSQVEELNYYCLLCYKTGSERNIVIHLTSLHHYLKYLATYFPRLAQKVLALQTKNFKRSFGLLVAEIVGDIEAKYGRKKPHSEPPGIFYDNRKAELGRIITEGPHIREAESDNFESKATMENLQRKNLELQQQLKAEQQTKNEKDEKTDDGKEMVGSMFNKTSRISVDKKKLRSREEDNPNKSPDVQIVDIQLPKEKNKRMRSRSLSSISTISNSSTKSRNRFHYGASSRHSKMMPSKSRRNWSRSRSRSRSPSYRHYHRSPPKKKYSPGFLSRDRAPRNRSRNRRDSHGRSPDSYRSRGVDRYGRTRDYDTRNENHQREKTTGERGSPKDINSSEEKVRWVKFREDLKKIETVKLEKLKFHEKNPEKHPHYPEEWKSFWNRRYSELQRSGVDPSKHDFKPEWISFWTKRMKELYEEDLGQAKDELKKKFDLPEDPQIDRIMTWKNNPRRRNNTSPDLVDISPPTPDRKDVMADIKTTWKAFTGSDIKDTPKRPLSPWEEEYKTRGMSPSGKREYRRMSPRTSLSPQTANEKLLEDMPQRKSKTSPLIFVLRKLTVLEQQLGFLAPKVFELMSQSLALEKIKEDASLDLLFEEDNAVYLETVREKLIALLCAGVVPRNVVNTARSAIKNIDIALYISSKRARCVPIEAVRSTMGFVHNQNVTTNQSIFPPKSEPVVVPGVGQVDKAAIAQQIAVALIEQGKTNVTEGELEQLINAVVGMAEASVNSAQPMTTANFLHQLQAMQNASASSGPTINLLGTETSGSFFKPPSQLSNNANMSPAVSNPPQASFGALKLLQSAYNEPTKAEQDSPKREIETSAQTFVPISDEELASTLSLFNSKSKEEQVSFMQKLQSTNPHMYKRLCPFIPASIVNTPEHSKRSPINIQISKERSEPKIKPLKSGRLSPFSSRSGGANPSVVEDIVLDLEDDYKTEEKAPHTPSQYHESQKNLGTPKHKFSNNSDMDDDDDDDDYSYEDVYKAAQEKLRQRQINEDKVSNQLKDEKVKIPNESKDIEKVKMSETIDLTEQQIPVKTINTAFKFSLDNQNTNDQQIPAKTINTSFTFSLNNQNTNFNLTENVVQPKRLPINESSNTQIYQQKPLQPNVNEYENLELKNQPDSYCTVGKSTEMYDDKFQVRQLAENFSDSPQQAFDPGSVRNYSETDQYPRQFSYFKESSEYYGSNTNYPREAVHPSAIERPHTFRHDMQRGDPYPAPYRDAYSSSYNPQMNPDSGSYGNTMGDDYRYREPPYRTDSYSGPRPVHPRGGYPEPSAPPPRYPNPNYSMY